MDTFALRVVGFLVIPFALMLAYDLALVLIPMSPSQTWDERWGPIVACLLMYAAGAAAATWLF